MSKSRLFAAAALLSLLGFGITACGGGVTEVRLGAIISLEGLTSASGQSIRNGIEVAVQRVNEDQGGVLVYETDTRVPLMMEFRDSRSDVQAGIDAARELIELGVPAAIGGVTSDVTIAIAPLFQEAGVILLSPAASSPKITDFGDMVYRNYPSDALEAVNMADHVYNRAGIQEIAILASQSEYGMGIMNAFIERFRSLGGSVAARQTFPVGATDLSAQAEGLTGTDATGIYVAGYTAEVATVARALRGAGVELPLFSNGAIVPANLIQDGGDAVEGLVFPSTVFSPDPADTPENQRAIEFVEAYRARYGATPDTYAAHGYDAVLILVEAIEQRGLRPGEMSFYLNTMNPFEGAAGVTKFDEHGDVRKFHRMFVVRDGRAMPLEQGQDSGEQQSTGGDSGS